MAEGGLNRLLQPVVSRPNLLIGIAAGVAISLAAGAWIGRPVTRGLIGWDAGVALFIVLSMISMWDTNDERMKARAIAHDEGRHFMLGLALAAAGASIVAIMAELSGAKAQGQLHEALALGLTAGTIALSWFFLHLVFAIHYAHVYYTAQHPDAVHKGGLSFPDDDTPDYWDFLHFAVVIGATAQTADISITSKEFRRVATVHCLIAFAFNTAILATMINLAAGLF